MAAQRLASAAMLFVLLGAGASAGPPERPPMREEREPAGLAAGIASTGCGESWRWANPLPQGSDLTAITYSAEHGFVAVGRRGAIVTSPDGIAWAWRNSGTDGDLAAVTWGGGQFVAIGPGYSTPPTILTSPDGVAWTPRGYDQPADLRQVIWNGERYLTAGGGTGFLTSSDGTSWSRQQTNGADGVSVNGLLWMGTRFIAVGEKDTPSVGPHAVVLASADGASWAHQEFDTVGVLSAVAWSGSRLVATALSGDILTSSDGTHWSVQNPTFWGPLSSVVWAGTQFVALGAYQDLPPATVVCTSPDGVNWARSYLIGSFAGASALAAGAGQTVLVGRSGTLVGSADGIEWTSRQQGPLTPLWDVAWGGAGFLAVGYYAQILTSVDGVAWFPSQVRTGGHFTGVTWDGSAYVVVGIGGAIATSPDGVSWTSRPSGTTTDLRGMAWNGEHLVAVGGAQVDFSGKSLVLTSSDGVTWSGQEVPTNGPLMRVRWLGGRFVAVGAGTVLTSPDALTWSDPSAGGALSGCRLADVDLHGVAWDGQRVVAVGRFKPLDNFGGPAVSLVSLDGVSWNCVALPSNISGFEDVIWVGGTFLAVGEDTSMGDVIMTSRDGVSWTRQRGYASLPLVALGSNGRMAVALGYQGAILTSDCPPLPRVRRHLRLTER